MKACPEYLRRNLMVAKAIGARTYASNALKRVEQSSRPRRWLIAHLTGIVERMSGMEDELAKWRNAAPDYPYQTGGSHE